MNKSNLIRSLTIALALFVCRTAWAEESCSITVSSSNFGAYDPLSPAHVDSTGQVQVACTIGTTFQVYLNAGLYSGGSFFPRKMKHGSLSWYFNYNLYTNAIHTLIWGDGTGGTSYVNGTGQGLGNPLNYTVYGRVPALQNVHVGGYVDMITATVRY